MAVAELLGRDQPAFQHEPLQSFEPDLVIAAGKITRGRQAFARRARLIEIPQTRGAHRQRQRKRTALPLAVERRLIGFRRDRTEIVHAAHVVHSVHGPAAIAGSGVLATPVPIIESRVTSVASRSSVHPRVPSGRIGSTR